jgi:hypothetical protein
MMRSALLAYQILTAFSDFATGILLLLVPAWTLRLMGVSAPQDALVFLSWIGAFVFAVGLSCIYGVWLMVLRTCQDRLETLWWLTALVRASVAIFVLQRVVVGTLDPGWLTVAFADGACVLMQGVGLWKGWLKYGAW